MNNLDRTWQRRVGVNMLALALATGSTTVLVGAGAANAAGPVDGPQTVGDTMFPHVGNGGYDARHYDVDISWETQGVVDGMMSGSFRSATTRMVATTTGRPLKSFSLDFEGLQVDSVTVNGTKAAYQRVEDDAAIKHKLVVTPRKPVKGEFTTVVKYHGVPAAHVDADESLEGWNATADGATFLGQPIGAMTAYPNNNTPGDKATYTFRVDVPSTLTTADGTGPSAVASNGELVARKPSSDGSRTTWEWVERQQMASELALISIGRYDVTESKVTLADGRVLPEWSFVDSAFPAADKAAIADQRAQLGPVIDRFASIYGRYPGNSVGVVVDKVPSGISYALETQDRPFFPSVRSLTRSLLHEVVHQWYGDAVSPKIWTDIFINEGMASWGPLWHNSVLANATPDPAAVEQAVFAAWDSVPADDAEWSVPPGAQTDPALVYEFQTYDRGKMFYEALRTAVGDHAFFGIVKQWQAQFSGHSQGRVSFKALAERISGRDLDAFWQDWILDGDKPAWPGKYDLTLTSPEGRPSPGTTLTYTLSAANVGMVPLADGRVTINLSDVLDDATLGALPAGLSRHGSSLTWTVPETATEASASTSFTVTVGDLAAGDTLGASAAPASLGGSCLACGAVSPAPRPEIRGAAVVGRTLRAVPGTWATGTTLSYRWLRDGTPIAGAKEATYRVSDDDLGARLSVRVIGMRTGYTSVARTSDSTRAITH